jgi:hypothetical protein
LSDLAYYPARKSLLVLDEGAGVLSYNIIISEQDEISIEKGQVHIQK